MHYEVNARDRTMTVTSRDVLAPVRDLDWPPEAAAELGEQIIGLWTEYLSRLRELPVGQADAVEEVRADVTREVPDEPVPPSEIVEYLRTLIFEHATLTGHPGFMAYITGAGTVPGAAADLIAAAINQNVGGWRLSPGATEIELHLMRWFAARLGLPNTASGFITSGGAMAALFALTAARDVRAGWDVRKLGVAAGPPLTMYASAEVHTVNARACDMLGLGAEALRLVPVDDALRMQVSALRDAIARDRSAGRRPIAVIATAGTVGTGAIDPLEEIAEVCDEEHLWFHVDGAYGGIAALTEELRPLFVGIERADSVALDPHKWLYTPHSGGAVILRDQAHLAQAFGVNPSYVHEDKELTRRGLDFYAHTPNFSRGFHALKIWISLLAHGWSAYQRRIAHDVALTRYLFERAAAHDELETVGPPPELSIACFRYVPPELRGESEAELYVNTLNERLMAELQLGGRVFPSNAVINGRFAIRACIVNFRTEASDIDALIDESVRHGRRLHSQRAATT
jgi:glutamate/tyrosine decarboxylase-like PLP-dependent enzyme